MAVYTSLPLYKESYDLSLELFQITQNMPREFKFTIGEQLKNEVVSLVLNINEV